MESDENSECSHNDESDSDEAAEMAIVQKYLDQSCYPSDATKAEKSSIRRRAKHFTIKNSKLFYIQPSKLSDEPML